MIAEIWLYAELVLRTTVVFPIAANVIQLESGAAVDDIYNAMTLKIDGKDAGCVHDYTASTKLIVYGKCLDSVLLGITPKARAKGEQQEAQGE